MRRMHTTTLTLLLVSMLGSVSCSDGTAPHTLTGRWNGTRGADGIREVLLLTQSGATFSGTSFFEDQQGTASGGGVVSGSVAEPVVNFTLRRDGLVFSWTGTVNADFTILDGQFAGFSNALYVKASP